IYRTLGKEQQAHQVAALIGAYMQQIGQQGNDVEAWANGYVILAMADGLITPEELDDALYVDQTALDWTKQFIKTAPVQRQEFAEWMGKALKLSLGYESQLSIVDTILDKHEVDPVKLPYVEMAIKENWMGRYNGFFYPRENISWEEMVQVLENFKGLILEKQGFVENSGVITDIKVDTDTPKDTSDNKITITIEDREGKLNYILMDKQKEPMADGEDISQDRQISIEKETIILEKGKSVDSSDLRKGDKISYLVDENKQVRLLRVVDTTARIYGENIESIYKAHIYLYDPYEGSLVVNGLQKWNQGEWDDITDEQLYKSIAVDSDAIAYAERKKIDISHINTYYTDNEVYFAVSQQNDGTETVVLLNIIKEGSTQEVYDEVLGSIKQDSSDIKVKDRIYRLGESTIIIKEGKIIQKHELALKDKIYIEGTPQENPNEVDVYIIQVHNDQPSKESIKNSSRSKKTNKNK
ncbi:MAG: hypothetical protein AB7G87_09460, partial [Clostridia bacterium]